MSIESDRFQEDFKKSAGKHPQAISIDRLKDPMSGWKGDANICDYIVYRFPCQFYFELKSYAGHRIPITAITDTQYKGLLQKSGILGVCAGVLLNYRLEHQDGEPEEDELCYWVDIRNVKKMRDSGLKSITMYDAKDIGVKLEGSKKKVHWEYEIPTLLEKVQLAVMGKIG